MRDTNRTDTIHIHDYRHDMRDMTRHRLPCDGLQLVLCNVPYALKYRMH